MKTRFLVAPFLLLSSLASRAQTPATAAYQNFCQVGGQKVQTQGASSSTLVQASYPRCRVDVYLTGTQTRATLYRDQNNTPLGNPFTANADGSFLLFASTSQAYDIVLSGGSPNAFPQPFTLTDVIPGGGGSGGGGGGTVISGTAYHVAMFDPAKAGKNITDTPLTMSQDGTTLSFANGKVYSVLQAHGTNFAWMQLDNDVAPAGQQDARLILRDNGQIQLESLSGSGASNPGYGEASVFEFHPSSTLDKWGGNFYINVPTTIQQGLTLYSNPGNQGSAFYTAVSQQQMGWNHGTSGTFGMTPMTTTMSTWFNGFHGLWDYEVTNREQSGDDQEFNIGRADRGGTLEPSDEGIHLWRIEHQSVQPYYGFFQGASVNSTGHQVYSLQAQYNNYNMGPENALVDVTQRQSMNITAVASQGGGAVNSSIITTDDTHGTSVTGTIQNDNDAGNQDMSTPVQRTMVVVWTGSDPLHQNCVAWTVNGPGNGYSHSPEALYPTATANNGDGTWNVTVEMIHSHFSNDKFSCGGTVGDWIDYADKDLPGFNNYYPVEYHELVLEDPAPNQERVAHLAYGGMISFAHVTAAKRYPAVNVLDAMPSTGGSQAEVAKWGFTPNAGDQLAQFNTMQAAYAMWLENEALINPYESFNMFSLNMQGSPFEPSTSSVFNFALTPDLATFTYPLQTGPFLAMAYAPAASHVGGNCTGVRYLFCVSETEDGDDYRIFHTQYHSGGITGIGVRAATKRLYTDGGVDLGGPISIFQNAQVGGYAEYGIYLNNTGFPAIQSTIAVNNGTMMSRCGFANGYSLTAQGSGGFVSQWHVSSAMTPYIANATFCQLEGNKMTWVGSDTDATPLAFMDPGTGAFELGHGPMIVPQQDDVTHHWKLQVSSTGQVTAVQVD